MVKPSQAQYAGPAQTAAPVIPFMAFGASYDLDLVIASKDPRWDMHEFAMFPTRTGPVWIMKAARGGNLDQVLHVDAVDPDVLWPELPMERKSTRIKVDDQSTVEEGIDVAFELEDILGDLVEAEFKSKAPESPMRKRNGNTMGHSASQALVALDVAERESAFYAKLEIEGRRFKARKIAGVVPFQFVLNQTQGGLVVGTYAQQITGVQAFPASIHDVQSARVVFDPATDQAPAAEAQRDAMEQSLPEGVELNPVAPVDGAPAGETKPDAAPVKGAETVDGKPADAKAAPVDASGKRPPAEGTQAGDDGVAPAGGKAAPAAATAKGSETVDDLLGDEGTGEEVEVDPSLAVPVGLPIAQFDTVHNMASGKKVAQSWTLDHRGTEVVVRTQDAYRGIQYHYLVNGESLELYQITTTQYGRPAPTMTVTFTPALPDLRRPFSNRTSSRYVIDVNGQQNHAVGTVDVTSLATGGGVLKVLPTAPFWTEDRALQSTVNVINGQPSVVVQRISQ